MKNNIHTHTQHVQCLLFIMYIARDFISKNGIGIEICQGKLRIYQTDENDCY